MSQLNLHLLLSFSSTLLFLSRTWAATHMLNTRVPLVFTHFWSTRFGRLARVRLHMLAISFNYESHRLCVIRTLMCVGVKGRHRHENREMQVKMSSFKEATIVPTLQDVWMQDHRGLTLDLSSLDWCLASAPRTPTH